MSYDDCCNYFARKLGQWNSLEPHYSCNHYITEQGRQALCDELKRDNEFMRTVCPFLAEYAKGKEKDLLSSVVKDALALIGGDPIPVAMNILIGAALDACGYKDQASEFLKAALLAVLIGAAGLALYGAFKRK